jgi:hypothetical protein
MAKLSLVLAVSGTAKAKRSGSWHLFATAKPGAELRCLVARSKGKARLSAAQKAKAKLSKAQMAMAMR